MRDDGLHRRFFADFYWHGMTAAAVVDYFYVPTYLDKKDKCGDSFFIFHL